MKPRIFKLTSMLWYCTRGYEFAGSCDQDPDDCASLGSTPYSAYEKWRDEGGETSSFPQQVYA